MDTTQYSDKLARLGRRVVSDHSVAFAHAYLFDCGCERIYEVHPIWCTDSERLKPCAAHITLVKTRQARKRTSKK
jgi:hypothetical protein